MAGPLETSNRKENSEQVVGNESYLKIIPNYIKRFLNTMDDDCTVDNKLIVWIIRAEF